MSLEEANYIVTLHMTYSVSGWYWVIDTHTPYGSIIGYNKYEDPEATLLELEGFLRYFTKDVLKSGDTIRKYVEKHKPKKENE